jgi:transcriptional regulator with XRE-family HTH domain
MTNNIAFFRNEKDMTQEELAKEAGVSRGYISELENGNGNPTGKVMSKIANALGESIEKVFFTKTVQHVEQTKTE